MTQTTQAEFVLGQDMVGECADMVLLQGSEMHQRCVGHGVQFLQSHIVTYETT